MSNKDWKFYIYSKQKSSFSHSSFTLPNFSKWHHLSSKCLGENPRKHSRFFIMPHTIHQSICKSCQLCLLFQSSYSVPLRHQNFLPGLFQELLNCFPHFYSCSLSILHKMARITFSKNNSKWDRLGLEQTGQLPRQNLSNIIISQA